MKTLTVLLSFFFIQSSFGLVEIDRIANFYQTIDEKDEAISQGEGIIKFNLNVENVKIQYKVKKADGWSNWLSYHLQSSKRMIVDTFPAGNYQFKFEKAGMNTVYGNINLESQHYVEAVATMYGFEPVEEEYKVFKPAIYLYSETPVDLQLKVNPVGKFDFTYPTHKEDGWQVHVDENGLTCNGRQYDYLFWDATQDHMDFNYNFGFVFKGEETIAFLEEKLSTLGLNDREKQDFIAFWGPKLVSNDYNYVHFITGMDYTESIGSVESSEEIESSLRLFMGYRALSAPIPVVEQELQSFKRQGLTLVEWGGGEVFLKQLGL